MSFNFLFRARWGLLYLPILAVAALLVWLSFERWSPLPPRGIALAAGNPEGGYGDYARRYALRLEQAGVSTRIISDSGWMGVTNRFAKESDETQAGFVQGVLADRLHPNVQALAVVAREPLWVVTRLPNIQSPQELRGARVALGLPETASHINAQRVLTAHGLSLQDVLAVNLHGLEAMNTLINGNIDAVIQLLAVQTQAVQVALQNSGLHFVGLSQGEAIRSQEPRLRPMVLPQGAVDLRSDVPPRDLPMLSTNTHLVVRASMHPALQRLLLKVATEAHEVPSLLQRDRDYPSWSPVDIPLSPYASAGAASLPGFEATFPYWWAQLAQTLALYVIPILLVTLLLLYWIPRWFDWRVEAALLHYYGELRFIDDDLTQVASEQPIALNNLLQRLDEIEHTVARLRLPDSYSERWYTLRSHLARARQRLLDLRSR